MNQFDEYYKPIEFVLHFHFVKEDKSRTDQIYNQLSKEKKLRAIPINPQYEIYAVKATHSKMKLIFESLKDYIEAGEAMGYCIQDMSFSECFVRYRNVVEV